jgi:lysozyme
MKISQTGLDAIKRHEGLRLTAYPDPASGGDPWTIGYGHTRDVERGQTITAAQAEQFLREDLAWVESCIERNVVAPLTQGQYDALCSLIFNIGQSAFTKSTLMRLLNQRDYAGAAQQFERWNIADGRVNLGLTTRRAAERSMFLSDAPTAPPSAPAGDPTQYSQEAGMPIPALVTALLPSVVAAIPRLAAIFKGGSEVAERNVAAASAVLDIVTQATGSVNAQAAVEKLQTDPAAVAAATKAVESNWFQLAPADGGGIAGARQADAAMSGNDMMHSPSFWVAIALLPLVYMIVGSVVGLFGTPWSEDVRSAIANGVVGMVIGALAGYYFGQTTSRNRTTAP